MTAPVTTEDLKLAITFLNELELEDEAFRSWKKYRAHIDAARRHVAELQLRQLRDHTAAAAQAAPARGPRLRAHDSGRRMARE